MTIDRERAIIAHFPIGAAINCAIGDVEWEYIEVELSVGFEMGQAVADLAASNAYRDAFSQPIAATDELPPSVEQRAEGDGPPSPPPSATTPDEQETSVPVPTEIRVAGVTFAPNYPGNLKSIDKTARKRADSGEPPLDCELRRNPLNEFDTNTIEVHVIGSKRTAMVGHIDATTAAAVAPLMDAGQQWCATVAFVAVSPDNPDRPGIVINLIAPSATTHTLAEAKAIANRLDGGERARIRESLGGKTPDDDADAFIAAVMHIAGFHDVVTEPPAPDPRPLVEASRLPSSPDEGGTFSDDDDAVDQLNARYQLLDPAAVAWVNSIVVIAKRAGLDIRMRDYPTSRRWHLLSGLITLADGFADDDAVRGILAPIIGAELADSKAFSLGQLVGCCDATQAAAFRNVAFCLAEGSASMLFTESGACRVEVAK